MFYYSPNICPWDNIRVYNIRIGWLVTEGQYMYTTIAGKARVKTEAGLVDFDTLDHCFLGPESLRHLDKDGNRAE